MSITATRLRAVADAFERGEAEPPSTGDPEIDRILSLYRDACPAIVCGLRAEADALERNNVQ